MKLKGYVVQTSWGDPYITSENPGHSNEHVLCHREFGIDVALTSLRFDPHNEDEKEAAFREHKLNYLKAKELELNKQLQNTKNEIQELMALPSSI